MVLGFNALVEITHDKGNRYFVLHLIEPEQKMAALYKDGMLEVGAEKLAIDKKTGRIYEAGRDPDGGGLSKISPKEAAAVMRIVPSRKLDNQISSAQENLKMGSRRRYASTDGSTGGSAETELSELARYGFRPDPEVAFAITVPPEGEGYIVIIGHTAKGSPLLASGNIDLSCDGRYGEYDTSCRPPANVKLPATLHTYTFDSATGKFTQGPARTYTGPTGAGLDGAAKMK
ncbi:MAG: hypothetical protein LBC90_01685 [Candidatus Adiutrix sp.]|jgi:hypothetical protein|nr:hypothetical protein [Candidatus Adiutrix sp.]